MEILRVSGFAEDSDEERLEEANDGSMGDTLPENCHYRDEGCELATACLDCPFPQCVHEETAGRRGWQRKERAKEIQRLYHTESMGVQEIARRLGVSSRTVQRALQQKRKQTTAAPIT